VTPSERDIRLDTAAVSSDVDGPHRQNAVVSDLSRLVLVKLVCLEILPIVGKPLPHAVMVQKRSLDGAPRHKEHDVLRGVPFAVL
jgi:hypothetical protein